MKKSKLMVAVLSVAMVSSLFAGCASKKTAGGSSSGIDKDQHLTVAFNVNDVKTLDPSKSSDGYSGNIDQEAQETLGREKIVNGKDIMTKAGASDWKVSSDGKTWTFTIRPNKWSDGKAVTAKDYEYSIKRTLDKKTASIYAYLLTGAGIKGAAAYNAGKGSADDVGVKATDDKTLVITLDKPCTYFEKLLSGKLFTPQRQDIVEKYGDKYGTTADSMVYSGPFKVDSIQMGAQVKLSKNDSYWDKKTVKLQKVTVKFMPDESARMNSLMNGELDIAGAPTQEWMDKLKTNDKLKGYTYSETGTNYEFFNQKVKLFSNANVRKAFLLAYNHPDQIKAFWQGTGKAAYSWVPDTISIGDDNYRQKAPEFMKDNATEAKALLKKGLQELGMSTDPSKVKVTYLSGGTDSRSKEMADWVISNYKKNLGINVKVAAEEWAQFTDDVNNSKYEMAGMNWGADYNDPMTFFDMFQTGAGVVPTNWSNKEYDALVDDAKNTTDQAKRLADFQKAEKILINDNAVIIPTVFRTASPFVYKYVKNYNYISFLGPGASEWKYMYTQGR
ncbi:peptide ABC transporter substrate-binding protein [Clostridium oryzae]|uniref:Dipeptide-binding protein DppE n=1 Tax=Clostridium oryzae TaxID=1450648 RepID=A0A1V4IGB9_9CLOT|nr:peptide ABC transporter substrate-binding protein [Clostridium oryzae]OPJ59042.1 dipeptide-binding protein DppE precursor [Clostridium oryzae]